MFRLLNIYNGVVQRCIGPFYIEWEVASSWGPRLHDVYSWFCSNCCPCTTRASYSISSGNMEDGYSDRFLNFEGTSIILLFHEMKPLRVHFRACLYLDKMIVCSEIRMLVTKLLSHFSVISFCSMIPKVVRKLANLKEVFSSKFIHVYDRLAE